ncbi:MAG: DUF402 domain-containing protein [Nocardioidaceae bacterium]
MNDVRVVFSKWGDRPHWECDAHRLGEDEHGTWLGLPQGTVVSRPGSSYATKQRQVALIPSSDAYVASFYAPGGGVPCSIYVDVTTRPVWDGPTLRVVDLDLDVIKGWTGRVWVDDEDEFADHRVRFGYPDEIVELAIGSCAAVRRAVESGLTPFDGVVSDLWMGELEAAMMKP